MQYPDLNHMQSNLPKYYINLFKSSQFKEIVQSLILTAFCKNTNLEQIIVGNTIEHNKKLTKPYNKLNDKCSLCLANNTQTFSCMQVAFTGYFKSNQTKHVLKSFHNINCNSK